MNIHRTAGIIVLLACSLLAMAQSQDFDPTAYPSFGDVGIEEYRPVGVEEAELGGTLVFVATTPGGQAADVNLTGPDGLKFDFVLETDGETVLEELPAGIYSVAATDESMQLAEGKVAVRQGQRGFVSIALVPIPDFHYDLADHGPYGDVQVGAYEGLEGSDGTGSLLIATNLPDEAELNVTGPNGYRRDFIGNVILTNLTLSDLDPGPYSVAATAEGYALTEGKVEVRAGELVSVMLYLTPLD